MHIFDLWYARFSWKLSVKVVFIFSSKTSILVWCGLKQAENEPKTTHVSDPRLSLCKNDRFQKRAYSACFQAENDLYINSGTDAGGGGLSRFFNRVGLRIQCIQMRTSTRRWRWKWPLFQQGEFIWRPTAEEKMKWLRECLWLRQ